MRASTSFYSRHSVALHAAAWVIFIGVVACDGYFDLPSLSSAPLSACLILVGVPFIIAMSIRGPVPDISLPESLRRFIRYSPYFLGGLWVICFIILIMVMLGEFHVRSVLR
ncbi:MAG: hypothetical protein QM813_06455 [Verrucomicrobiota bacterium]